MKQHKRGLSVWLIAVVLLFIAAVLAGTGPRSEIVQGSAVLHDTGQTGLKAATPRIVSAVLATAIPLTAAVLIRVFAIPRFKLQPGKLQLMLEGAVGMFDSTAEPADNPQNEFMEAAAKAERQKELRQKRKDWFHRHKKGLAVWLSVVVVLLVAAVLVGPKPRSESVQEAMRDAVLHDSGQIGLLGLKTVNPGMVSALLVTALLLAAAALIRVLVIPRFQLQPGRFQMVLEEAVGLFDGMAKSNSPHRNRFVGAYIFAAGAYIFVGTLFELLGLQAVTVHGHPITLPAPLSDVNAAIALGTLSYLAIVSGGVAESGPKGILKALKEFSLPISMSFRLFGALLSGLLVTELVYYYVSLSFVLPVVVGVLFTLLHALIQTYVLTMLVSMYYGEVSEPPHNT